MMNEINIVNPMIKEIIVMIETVNEIAMPLQSREEAMKEEADLQKLRNVIIKITSRRRLNLMKPIKDKKC